MRPLPRRPEFPLLSALGHESARLELWNDVITEDGTTTLDYVVLAVGPRDRWPELMFVTCPAPMDPAPDDPAPEHPTAPVARLVEVARKGLNALSDDERAGCLGPNDTENDVFEDDVSALAAALTADRRPWYPADTMTELDPPARELRWPDGRLVVGHWRGQTVAVVLRGHDLRDLTLIALPAERVDELAGASRS